MSSNFSSSPGKPWQPPTPEDLAPELPQYEVLGLLGRGGMGAVYKARQKSLDREVAIKILPPAIEDADMHYAERFIAEARSMAKLEHPNIIAVYDAGQTPSGLLYFVMQYVQGTDVAQMILSSGRLPPEHAYAIVAHVCEALAYAHANNLIHRDIKPANIMVDTQGRVKVADFGLAKTVDANSGFTQSNVALGTPDFVAPEAMIPGMNLDGRADLYAVGVMLYQMLTGSIPRGLFKPVSAVVPGIDTRFDQIVHKAMQMDREERHSSAEELRQHLDSLLMPAVPAPALQQYNDSHPQPQTHSTANGKAAPPQQRPIQKPTGGSHTARASGKLGSSPSNNAASKEKGSNLSWIIPTAISAVIILGGAFYLRGQRAKPPADDSAPPASTTATAPSAAASEPAKVIESQKAGPPSASTGTQQASLESGAIRLWDSPDKLPRRPGILWEDGAMRVDSGMAGSTYSAPYQPEPASRDATLQTKVRSGADGTELRVLLRRSASQIGYVLAINPSRSYVRLNVAEQGGRDKLLKEWPLPEEHRGDKWIQVGLRVLGDELSVGVGGKGLGSVRDNTVSKPGGVAVSVKGNGYFRDIVYVPLDQPHDRAAPVAAAASAKPSEVLTFGEHRYQLVQEAVTWDEAKAKAEAMGGHLVTITTKEENDWIASQVLSALKPLPGGWTWQGSIYCSIGAYRAGSPAVPWKWVTGETFSAQPWMGNFANDGGNDSKVLGLAKGVWDDIGPDRKLLFLVEWDDDGPARPTATLTTSAAATSTGASATGSSDRSLAAPVEPAFENVLGMKFVPVPITGGPTNGQRVLFSIWETRVQDFEVFAKETGRQWDKEGGKKQDFELGPTHPASVNWNDATAFCAWLTERERKAGKIGASDRYRLPSDHEWSCAAGIGDKEDAALLPSEKKQGIPDVFPWGTSWPPPDTAGKYAGIGKREPAPVGSFAANQYGLYDMGGNAWEWCEDMFDKDQNGRTLRGSCWHDRLDRGALSSSHREKNPPTSQGSGLFGMRAVLAVFTPASALASGSASVPPELTALDEQFLKLKAERVTAPFEADVAKLNTGYIGGIDRAIADEKKAGRLDGILALEAEKKLIESKKPMPETDDAATLPAIKSLRSIYRGAYAKLVATRDANLKTLTEPLDKRLAQMETDFIKADRIPDAKTIRAFRDALAKSSGGLQPAQPLQLTSGNTASGQKSGTTFAVSKEGYANTLGMKFVAVKDTDILMCIHETRCKDWAAYAAENPSAGGVWKPRPVDGFTVTERAEDHPVTNVNWEQAHRFCEWLSKKEGKYYRMPTDREWSYAAGVGSSEKWRKDSWPSTITRDPDEFPWGRKWPPSKGAGNFSDQSRKEKAPNKDARYLDRYDDGFPTTAPVMSFEPNKFGLYDLSGNVWEWVEDYYDEGKGRALRGGGWVDTDRGTFLSSNRWGRNPEGSYDYYGFRIVLVPGGRPPAAEGAQR